MMQNLRNYIGIMMLALGLLLVAGAVSPSHAASGDSVLRTYGGNACSHYSDAKGVLLGHIVPCVANTIEEATIRMASKFSNFVRPIFYAFLTLVITFFGVKLLQGEQDMQKQAVYLLLKTGFVVVFINNFAGLTPYVYDVIQEGQEIMVSAIGPKVLASAKAGIVTVTVTMASNDVHCDISKFDPGGPGGIVWAQMDCMLSKIMGFTLGTGGGPNMALAASVLGLLGGFFFGGTFGLAVMFAAIGFIISLFSFVLKTAFAFLNGYILAGIYIIISPLFIPLALMRVTGQYFDSWWKGLVSAMLMPVIVTGYAVIALMVYDKLLLAPDSEINRVFDKAIFASAAQHCKSRSVFDGIKTGDQTQDTATASGKNFMNGLGFDPSVCTVSVDWKQYTEEGGENAQKFFVDLLMEFARLFILAIIMAQGLESLLGRISNLTGKGSANSALTPQQGMEQNIAGSMNAARAAMQDEMSRPLDPTKEKGDAVGAEGARGTLFVSRLGSSFTAGLGGFVGGITGAKRQ